MLCNGQGPLTQGRNPAPGGLRGTMEHSLEARYDQAK